MYSRYSPKRQPSAYITCPLRSTPSEQPGGPSLSRSAQTLWPRCLTCVGWEPETSQIAPRLRSWERTTKPVDTQYFRLQCNRFQVNTNQTTPTNAKAMTVSQIRANIQRCGSRQDPTAL